MQSLRYDGMFYSAVQKKLTANKSTTAVIIFHARASPLPSTRDCHHGRNH